MNAADVSRLGGVAGASGAASEWVSEPTAPEGFAATGPNRLAIRSFVHSPD
jgi:hypothetical protein